MYKHCTDIISQEAGTSIILTNTNMISQLEFSTFPDSFLWTKLFQTVIELSKCLHQIITGYKALHSLVLSFLFLCAIIVRSSLFILDLKNEHFL